MGTTPAGLYTIKKDQKNAARAARTMANHANDTDGLILDVQDMVREAGYVIFVYNILAKQHIVEQAPKFPRFIVPACPKGEKFSFTVLPAFTKETFYRADRNECYYKTIDGRKDATTLLNPTAFPGTDWEAQLGNWESEETTITGTASNLNSFGCFWSLTHPELDAKSKHIPGGTLADEIERFKEYAMRTMQALVRNAELLVAAGKLNDVTPNMHFAMDYLGKKAAWHMSMDHMVSCPTCGESIKDGIAYHRDAFGERCIVDYERCVKLNIVKPTQSAVEESPTPARRTRKSA